MAGGVAPIDFWAVFNGAADAAHRKRLEDRQISLQEQERQDAKDQHAAAVTNAKLENEAWARAQSGDPSMLQSLFGRQYGDFQKQQLEQQKTQREFATQDQAQAEARSVKAAQFKDAAARVLAQDPSQLPRIRAMAKQYGIDTPEDQPLTNGLAGPPTPVAAPVVAQQFKNEAQLEPGAIKPEERKTTSDMLEAASNLGYHGDIAKAEQDPRWAATLTKVSSSKATQINTGDLNSRTAGQFAAADSQAEIVKRAIDEINRLTNGDPDLFGKVANKGIAWGTDVAKALGMNPNASAEDVSQRQEEIQRQLDLIGANSVFHNENGQVEADMSSALTKGANLKAGLSALSKQMDMIQSVHARRARPGQAIGPPPPGPGAGDRRPPPPPEVVAAWRQNASKDPAAAAALKNYLAHGGK